MIASMVSSQWHNIKLIEYYNVYRALKGRKKREMKKKQAEKFSNSPAKYKWLQ